MKILLVGEYSGVHSELKSALIDMGHQVVLLSDGDSYKNFQSDIEFKNPQVLKGKISIIINLFREFLGLTGLFYFLKNWKRLKYDIKDFDIIQLINPVCLSGFGSIPNLIFLRFLSKQKSKIFLCALGDDYYWVKDCLKGENKFVALSSLTVKSFVKNSFSTKYTHGFLFKTLNDYALKISKKVIPGLYDYKRVYEWSPKLTSLIPLPLSDKKIKSSIKLTKNSKIVIFHGWQRGKEKRKGNDIFDEVIKKLLKLYPDKIEYKVVQNLPYEEYITSFESAHIALDQCYSYDKGVNGLLYMAAGKVTFTGLEKLALNEYLHYNPNCQIGINATSNKELLLNDLIDLIDNPHRIEEISKNAIDFVIKNHESKSVADMYLKIWEVIL